MIAFTLLAFAASIASAEPFSPDVGLETLRKAFDNLYDCDMKMSLEVELHDQRGSVSRRRANIARKRIRGHTHSIGRFFDPPWMRGTTMLMIDNTDRSDDHFIYLPERKRTRRLTSVQRADAFLGSDLWYEDLERRYPEDYQVIGVTPGSISKSATIRVRVRPREANSAYDQVEFEIARSDYYLLTTSYFKDGSESSFRSITSSREHMTEQDGHRIPTRYVVSNSVRGTKTVATFSNLEVNPELSDTLFRAVALEVGRKIPGLETE